PREERVQLGTAQILAQLLAHRLLLRLHLAEIVHERGRDRLPNKLPENSPQLGVLVEGQPVIDAPNFARTVAQAMTELPIRVVGDVVEQDEALDFLAARAPELTGIFVIIRHRLDVELHAPDPLRTVPDD